MKTKDFIKMIQDADPSGEAHIRMSGGVPHYADCKPGYYDGAYRYIDENGNYITTTNGNKVDIWCKEPSDYIWDDMDFDPYKDNVEESWEILKSKFKFEYGYNNDDLPKHRKDDIERFFKNLRSDFDYYIKSQTESSKEYLHKVMEMVNKGYRFYQNIVTGKIYDWILINPNGKEEKGTSPSVTDPITLSGLFEKIDCGRENYKEWILKK
jgi:hypothetical protein